MVLTRNLANAHATIREALLGALNVFVRISDQTTGPNFKLMGEKLMVLQLEDLRARSTDDNLIHLQALLFMALTTDSSGPVHLQQSPWIDLALKVAIFLKLQLNGPCTHVAGSDPDTYDKLSRRAWLILVVIDRWHASSITCRHLTDEDNSALFPEDKDLLGVTGYRFARRYPYEVNSVNVSNDV